MKDTITAALSEANASAVMIVGGMLDNWTPEHIAAMNAICTNERRPSPLSALNAEDACVAYLVTAPEIAMAAINARIAASAPLSEGSQRALRGED